MRTARANSPNRTILYLLILNITQMCVCILFLFAICERNALVSISRLSTLKRITRKAMNEGDRLNADYAFNCH